MAKPRDYAKEYREYQGTPAQIANRAARNKARRMIEKKVGKAALVGKDVDHIRSVKAGGKSVLSNLRVMSVNKNRGRNNNK